LTSGLLSFAFQWRSVWRAIQSVGAAFGGKQQDDGEVPMIWFFFGTLIFGPLVMALEYLFFGIPWWMGMLSVFLGFFTAIVACRVTGETDTTPTGALGKITQITFGWLAPGNMITNLMTANVTGGIGLHAADLLTDLKSGYLLKADPRQQFWAQFFGVLAGSVSVVVAFNILVPNADELGGDKWPAPGAQTWKGVAEMLAKGLDSMHPTAQAALVIGGIIGILLVLLEKALPKYKHFIPSPAGLGLAFTTPGYNTISMFIGACIALVMTKQSPKLSEKLIVPVSSGWIAGESLMGVGQAIFTYAAGPIGAALITIGLYFGLGG
jgi:OPT family oligopeptide transporter